MAFLTRWISVIVITLVECAKTILQLRVPHVCLCDSLVPRLEFPGGRHQSLKIWGLKPLDYPPTHLGHLMHRSARKDPLTMGTGTRSSRMLRGKKKSWSDMNICRRIPSTNTEMGRRCRSFTERCQDFTLDCRES